MSHLKRVLAITVTTVVLIAVVAPAVQAISLRQPPTPRVVGGDWLDAALSWLSHVFAGAPQAPQAPHAKKKPDPDGSSGGVGTVGPMGGSCVDPNGCLEGG
jgi:hypothetical protein